MMRLVGAVLVACALLTATAGSGAAGADAATTRGTFAFDRVIGGSCLAEAVAFSGQAHWVTHVTAADNGDLHVVGEVNYAGVRGAGVTTGTAYRVTAVLRIVETYTRGASTESDLADNAHVVSRGAADNLILRTSYHVTRNAAGRVTVELARAEVVCRG
jgi:hypothetical protein